MSSITSGYRKAGHGLLLAGLGLAFVAVAADVLGFGSGSGLGRRQLTLLAAGGLLVAFGLLLGGGAELIRTARQIGRHTMAETMSARRLIGASILLGSWAGLIEVLLNSQRERLSGSLLVLSYDAVWMTPVATTLLVLSVGLAVLAVFLPFRRGIPLQPAVTAIVIVSVLAVLDAVPQSGRIELYARLIVAVGIGITAVRIARSRIRTGSRLLENSLLGTWVLILAMGTAVQVRRSVTERRAMANLPAPATGPDILFIILDTVRGESLSLLGYDRPTTPFLESFARQAVVFDSAYTTSSWTLPSHGSMFTGRYPQELSASWLVALDDTWPTIAEVLRDAGYATAGFVANRHYGAARFGLGRGFVHYEDFDVSVGEILTSSATLSRRLLGEDSRIRRLTGYHQLLSRKSAADINRSVLRWFDGKTDRPRFAFLNYFDAHDPYLPPPPFDTMFAPPRERENPSLDPGWNWTPDQVAAERDAYDRSIAWLDHSLSRLFAELRRRGKLDNTIVVITSDHGEHLGEHGLMGHARTLYPPVLHVPLVIAAPGRTRDGYRVSAPASLRDIAATILDLADIDDGTTIPGTSLARYWDGGKVPHRWIRAELERSIRTPRRYPSTHGDLQTFIGEGYQYIRSTNGTEELYVVGEDEAPANNLLDDEGLSDLVERFRRRTTVQIPDSSHAAPRR